MPDALRVLIVGAGAVGQVYGWYLTQGGAKISFFTKPKHVLPDELPMLLQVRKPVVLTAFGRLTSLDEVRKQVWDQVWLAVPSNAMTGAWLPELMAATGNCTVVALAPEGEVALPPSRRVVGSIPFIAWQDPLPGHVGPARMAVWVPPFAPVSMSGVDRSRVEAVRAVLRVGGLRTAIVGDMAKTGFPLTAVLISSIAALEGGAKWQLSGFRGRWSALAGRAARELMANEGIGGFVGVLFGFIAHGPWLRFAFWAASKVLPFDFETYLKYHFTKVGEQTRVFLKGQIERGAAQGTPLEAVKELLGTLSPVKTT